MGKSSTPESFGGWDTADAAVRPALDTIAEFAAGRDVSPSALDTARDAILHPLRSGSGSNERQITAALTDLFVHSPDTYSRAELLGHLLASGPRAAPPLQALLEGHPDLVRKIFRADEAASLVDLLAHLPTERLATLTEWLTTESGINSPEPGTPDPERTPGRPNTAISPRRDEHGRSAKKVTDALPDSLDDPPDQTLRNTLLPEEQRAIAAERLGAAAIPILDGLAGTLADAEFATREMIIFGRRPEYGRAVREAAARMTFDPYKKDVGNKITRALNGEQGHVPGQSIQDGWLARALQECSAPSILSAAAGREAMVIPLVTRRLTELRQLREFTADSY